MAEQRGGHVMPSNMRQFVCQRGIKQVPPGGIDEKSGNEDNGAKQADEQGAGATEHLGGFTDGNAMMSEQRRTLGAKPVRRQ